VMHQLLSPSSAMPGQYKTAALAALPSSLFDDVQPLAVPRCNPFCCSAAYCLGSLLCAIRYTTNATI
jgi:hypothetical protein